MLVEKVLVLPEAARELAREVLIHGPVDRRELGRRLRLSPASLTRLAKPYFDAGLFVEGEELPRTGSGRRARPLDVRAEAMSFIGIKLTGDDATGVLTDLRANVLGTVHRSLPAQDPDSVVALVAEMVTELSGRDPVDAVGVSVGGRARDRRFITEAGYLDWHDVPLADLLEARIGAPVTVENDVVALMAAEHWFGPARALDTFALVTVGAGVGYALVLRDEVVTGPDTGLGSLGHAPLEPNGPLCAAGHRGCATAMLTIPGICSQVSAVRGEPVTFDEVLAGAAAGDTICASVVTSAARALGRLAAWIANTTTATTVVVSGEGNGLFRVAERQVREACARDRLPGSSEVDFLVEEPDFIMWARGAAAVAIQDGVTGASSKRLVGGV